MDLTFGAQASYETEDGSDTLYADKRQGAAGTSSAILELALSRGFRAVTITSSSSRVFLKGSNTFDRYEEAQIICSCGTNDAATVWAN